MQGRKALLGVIGALHDRIAREDLRISLGSLLGQLLIHVGLHLFADTTRLRAGFHASGPGAELRHLPFVVLPKNEQRLIGLAVERIFLHQRLQSRDRCRIR